MDQHTSISVTDDYFKKIDLSLKKSEIFQSLQKIPHLKFNKKSIWESRYWGKGVGAFQIEGSYRTKNNQLLPVIIKIQGSKPLISEAKILEKLNLIKTKNLKFPKVIFYQPWDNSLQYEIVIFEKITADFIITPHQLANKDQVEKFFYGYQIYKKFSKKITPFIKKPKEKINFLKQFLKWRQIRLENKLKFLITSKEDEFFLGIAKKLNRVFKKTPPVFQHCHLSVYDIKRRGNNFYLFSNLFWGYRWPYYDATFGFMWYILGIASYEKEEISNQIRIWEKSILRLNKNEMDKISLALIERYLAALNLDILMINKKENILKIKKILLEELKEKLLLSSL